METCSGIPELPLLIHCLHFGDDTHPSYGVLVLVLVLRYCTRYL